MTDRSVSVAGVDVRIEAPKDVVAFLGRMLQRIDRGTSGGDFVVRSSDFYGSTLDVAERVIGDMVDQVASHIKAQPIRGAVLRCNDTSIALFGDEARRTMLAAHLSARGWLLLSPAYSFVDPRTLDIVPLPKLMRINAGALDRYPSSYRSAVESSPWCTTERDLTFYAVDPTKTRPVAAWDHTGRLRAMVVLAENDAETPSLCDAEASLTDPYFRPASSVTPLGRCTLTVGPLPQTATMLENWSESLLAGS